MSENLPFFQRSLHRLKHTVSGPQALAFLPAIVLGAFWFGGERWLLGVSLGLPVAVAVLGGFKSQDKAQVIADVPTRVDELVERQLAQAQQSLRPFALVFLEIDDFDDLVDHHGLAAANRVASRVADRIIHVLRHGDLILRSDNGRISIALAPVTGLDLEAAIQLVRRIQDAVEEPVSLDATSLYVSCSIGFVLNTQLADPTAHVMIEGADAALDEARLHAPSAIRAYTPGMRSAFLNRGEILSDVEKALDTGQFQPWFQPQVSTETGLLTGFEALARWKHPERGLIPPSEFLPVLERHGLLARLGQEILLQSLTALKDWDKTGVKVPCVGINFSPTELRDPTLAEKVAWELDRFDLTPDRICVEVLETVVAASPDDVVARNINRLAQMGCPVDLDDFGTGHASISSIRRFSIRRIKIDRSFVIKMDQDPEQQRMVTAILTMAEQLGLDTLAEGVETVGEHSLLSQLGCGEVQGFGIARPMPVEQTLDWIRANQVKFQNTPKIGGANL